MSDLQKRCVAETMCDGEAVAFGLCNPHYRRLKRHGVLYSPKALAGLRSRRQRALDYYYAHRDERLAYLKARYHEDLDASRAAGRATYRRRAHKHHATGRARERGMKPLDAASVLYDRILRRDPCCYCGGPMQHVDHVDPVAHGGANHWENLTAACQPCNRSKSDKPLLIALLGGT